MLRDVKDCCVAELSDKSASYTVTEMDKTPDSMIALFYLRLHFIGTCRGKKSQQPRSMLLLGDILPHIINAMDHTPFQPGVSPMLHANIPQRLADIPSNDEPDL
jgi:hypothetical protein